MLLVRKGLHEAQYFTDILEKQAGVAHVLDVYYATTNAFADLVGFLVKEKILT